MNQSEVEDLIRLAGREYVALHNLQAALDDLRASKDAQVRLQELPAEVLRSALASRTRILNPLRVVGS